MNRALMPTKNDSLKISFFEISAAQLINNLKFLMLNAVLQFKNVVTYKLKNNFS